MEGRGLDHLVRGGAARSMLSAPSSARPCPSNLWVLSIHSAHLRLRSRASIGHTLRVTKTTAQSLLSNSSNSSLRGEWRTWSARIRIFSIPIIDVSLSTRTTSQDSALVASVVLASSY